MDDLAGRFILGASNDQSGNVIDERLRSESKHLERLLLGKQTDSHCNCMFRVHYSSVLDVT